MRIYPRFSVYSPAFSTASSASLQTPKSSTVNLMDPYASPKSVSSVKRKPVPRYLYNETGSAQASPQHNRPVTQSIQSMSSAAEDGSIGTTLPLSFKKGTKSVMLSTHVIHNIAYVGLHQASACEIFRRQPRGSLPLRTRNFSGNHLHNSLRCFYQIFSVGPSERR